jgi:predicted ABC-type ATPase
MGNLAAAIAIADRVYIYDNSLEDTEAKLCARTVGGKLHKTDGDLPQWVADAVLGLPPA